MAAWPRPPHVPLGPETQDLAPAPPRLLPLLGFRTAVALIRPCPLDGLGCWERKATASRPSASCLHAGGASQPLPGRKGNRRCWEGASGDILAMKHRCLPIAAMEHQIAVSRRAGTGKRGRDTSGERTHEEGGSKNGARREDGRESRELSSMATTSTAEGGHCSVL